MNAKQIKSVNLNFQPDEQFKADLQKATFVWVDKLAAGTASDSASSADNGGDSSSSDSDGGSSSSGGDSGLSGDE